MFMKTTSNKGLSEKSKGSYKDGSAIGISPFYFVTRIVKYLNKIMSGSSLNRWWHLKNKVRERIEKYTIYVLQCENGKYYVGSTKNKKRRFKQHQSDRGGSRWTRLNRPICVLKEYKRVPEAYHLGMEAKITAEFMLKYGVNNVRGAMFCKAIEYTLADLDALTGFLGHYNEMSYDNVRDYLSQRLPRPEYNKKSWQNKKKARKGKKQYRNKKSLPTDSSESV